MGDVLIVLAIGLVFTAIGSGLGILVARAQL